MESIVLNNVKTKSQMEYIAWHKDNPSPLVPPGHFERRTADPVTIVLPHASLYNSKTIQGIFDQSIVVVHTYDVPISVTMHPCYLDRTNVPRWLYVLPTVTMDAATGGGSSRLLITSDATLDLALPTGRKLMIATELRQAIPAFDLLIEFPGGAPTTGEMEIQTIRRY